VLQGAAAEHLRGTLSTHVVLPELADDCLIALGWHVCLCPIQLRAERERHTHTHARTHTHIHAHTHNSAESMRAYEYVIALVNGPVTHG